MADKKGHAGKVAVRRAIEAGRAAGLDVAGFELSPDGHIRIMEARALPIATSTLFDRLEAAGKL